jgi:hypothetical protein
MQQHVTVTCGTYNSAYGLSDYICNWFLIVMRPFGRARRDPGFSNERPAPPGVHRGKQWPAAPALRARAARIWPGTLSALVDLLARSPHH